MKSIKCYWALGAALALIAPALFSSDAYALIKDLGSNDDATRSAAVAQLRQMGEPVRPTLLEVESAEETPKNMEYYKDLLTRAENEKDEKGLAFAKQSIAKVEAAQAVLKKVGGDSLDPRQMLLIRRLLGDLQVQKSTLKPIDLSSLTPFGEDKEKGIKGDPELRLNIDKKIIVIEGEFAIEQGPLEYLVVTRGPNSRMHETVVGTYPRPRDICYALLASNFTYAGELGEEGQVHLPPGAGVMISVEFLWEDPNAGMDTGVNLVTRIAAIKQKAAQLEKVPAADRATAALDLDSDFNIVRYMLIGELPQLEKIRSITDSPDNCKAALEALEGFINNPPQNSAEEVKKMKALPVFAGGVERKLVRLPIEFFAWNAQTDRTMKRAPFAFTGSKFEKDDNGKPIFMADEEKSIVALKLDPYALLNTPLDMRAVDPQHAAGYGINQYLIPKRHTRCRVIFEAYTGAELTAEDLKDTGIDKGPAPPPKQQ